MIPRNQFSDKHLRCEHHRRGTSKFQKLAACTRVHSIALPQIDLDQALRPLQGFQTRIRHVGTANQVQLLDVLIERRIRLHQARESFVRHHRAVAHVQPRKAIQIPLDASQARVADVTAGEAKLGEETQATRVLPGPRSALAPPARGRLQQFVDHVVRDLLRPAQVEHLYRRARDARKCAHGRERRRAEVQFAQARQPAEEPCQLLLGDVRVARVETKRLPTDDAVECRGCDRLAHGEFDFVPESLIHAPAVPRARHAHARAQLDLRQEGKHLEPGVALHHVGPVAFEHKDIRRRGNGPRTHHVRGSDFLGRNKDLFGRGWR